MFFRRSLRVSVRWAVCRTAVTSAWSLRRCLEWPWAVSEFCDRPSVAGASRCALEAISSKHPPRDREPTWRSGD
jgi:hypothetical protein